MEFKNDTRLTLVLIVKQHNGTIISIRLIPNASTELDMHEGKAKTLSVHESSSQEKREVKSE